MTKNIYVLGMLDWQLEELQTIGIADQCTFHSLLSEEELIAHDVGFEELLSRARRQLDAGSPDAIVCHWDFPSSCLAPILGAEYGLPAPSLEAVLKCEHKFWARLEQRKASPDCTPQFEAIDPFAENAAENVELPFPFWLKPVKGFASQLGFRIDNREDLESALEEMRAHIGELGGLFDECLTHAELPAEVQGIGGKHALAEQIMSGEQFAHEGYVLNGEVHFHGNFDMMLDDDARSVAGLRYPAQIDPDLATRAEEESRKILSQVGFDNGCFNVEYLWDESAQKLWLIEVNTRISQSHCEMFRMVDGRSNHEIAVNVALGQTPHMPDHRGESEMAAKFYLTKHHDAEVTRMPEKAELKELCEEFGALVTFEVHEGDRLSELPNQPVYCYNVGYAWVPAEDADHLRDRYRALVERIPMEFSDGKRLSP